jgi:DNA polymerase/3'-5' exonuclease PolX
MGKKVLINERKVYHPSSELLSLAKDMVATERMKKHNAIICGGLRRGVAQVTGIVIVIEGSGPADSMDCLCGLYGKKFDITRMGSEGNRTFAKLNDYMINVFASPADTVGAMQLLMTGSVLFNKCLHARAKKLSMRLGQKGLHHGITLIAGKSEELIFSALGVRYLEPKDRSFSPVSTNRLICADTGRRL